MADADFQQQMREIERLVHEIELMADPHLRTRAVELVTLLMDVHGAALRRMLDLVAKSGPAGGAAITAFADDPLVASLLLLYGLHPSDLQARVLQALEKARPLLRGHGGRRGTCLLPGGRRRVAADRQLPRMSVVDVDAQARHRRSDL